MKKVFKSKISALIASLMVISMLVPVLAYAYYDTGIKNYKVDSGTVTGDVYVSNDVYMDAYNRYGSAGVPIFVYGADGSTVTQVAYATYQPQEGHGYYHFSFEASSVPCSTYQTIHSVGGYVYGVDGVATNVYLNAPCSSGGGYFPGIGSTLIDSNGIVDATALTNLFASDKNPTITSTSEVVTIPASALINGETLTIELADGTSITLPIAALKLEDLAKSLGVELSDLTIKVELKKLTGDDAAAVESAATGIGAKQLATPVDFKITAVAGDKEQAISKLDVYFKRTLPVTEAVYSEANSVTGVVFNPETKELSFVPSVLSEDGDNTLATLYRNSTSIYTVVQLDDVSFADLAAHWAKEDVETLASKLIVEGTGANKFEPNRSITRAEFAALIVRSLGLEAAGSTSKFSDVSSSKWYAGVVAAAADAGIVQGDEKGHFNPNANITRKELSAMVVRAMAYAGKDATLTDADATAALTAFTDAGSLGWAKAEVAAAVKAGIVQGQSSTKIAGNSNATRAEAATMVIRYLGNVGFINS